MSIRSLLLAVIAAVASTTVFASPASPYPFTYVQPDGTVITLRRHGDEFFNWTTVASTGQVVELDESGWYRPSVVNEAKRRSAMIFRQNWNREIMRSRPSLRTHDNNPMTHGERHIPVFLVQYKDIKFSLEDPVAKFDAMLNQKGYSENGATGSVRDFYYDNSSGAFTPVFDVYGVVDLPEDHTFYGGDFSTKISLIVIQAARELDDKIDFSRYDYDHDGIVDTVLFYYAGHNSCEGASKDHIWPHQYDVMKTPYALDDVFDGKYLGKYICSSELKGASGTQMASIGITCHEFAHSLGLPDFYPSNNQKQVGGFYYSFSMMDAAYYLNDFRTPIYFNALERTMLGWMTDDDIREFSTGRVSFGSVAQQGAAYKNLTETEGEFFVFECRDGRGWDAYLPKGMMVYHVDRSTSRTFGGLTPYDYWETWNLFGITEHPFIYLIPAGDPTSLNYLVEDKAQYMFPGSLGVTSYSPIDWEGNPTGLKLSDISYSDGDGKVSLHASYDNDRTLRGVVKEQDGIGIEGVNISIDKWSRVVSDKDGSFVISLDGYEGSLVHISFSKSGYKGIGAEVALNEHTTFFNTVLLRDNDSEKREYRYYDTREDSFGVGDGMSTSQMAAIKIPSEELERGGGKVVSVSFLPAASADAYYIIVDNGDERILTYRIDPRVSSQLKTVDISSFGVEFEGGKDLYVGIAVENCTEFVEPERPFAGVVGTGHLYLSSFDLHQSDWKQVPDVDLVMSVAIIGHENSRPDTISSLSEMGFNVIADPGNGSYSAGSSFALKLDLAEGSNPKSVSWLFDGSSVDGSDKVTLQAGSHLVTAILGFDGGATETLELELEVE